MKKILTLLLIATAGVGVGGGAAYATVAIIGSSSAEAKGEPAETSFVPAGKILAPLVFPDGRLAGYVSFDVHLDVPADRSEWVAVRLPLLLNAINMRTYRTPMTSGPDGMLPNIGTFRDVVLEASTEAFGAGAVQRVAVTEAAPA